MSDQSHSPPTVFLSYASQDSEAARRIAEALRALGVEVWFDQNELVGGDAWDAKIRQQIASCALFLPVISVTTQARLEGYFRIEWKLAAQRTLAMAEEKTFLLPIVIDGTRDAEAKVPAEFKAVQWTRLPDGETPGKFCARVKALLAAGSELHDERPRYEERGKVALAPARPSRGKIPKWLTTLLVVVPALAGLAIAWRGWPHGGFSRVATKESGAPAANVPAPAWPRDEELRRAMDMVNGLDSSTEDFVFAEEIINRALAKNSTDLEAVTVMARVQAAYLFRGFDRSDERRATARRFAERAMQLGPNDPEALGARGIFLAATPGGDLNLARELLERAIAGKPNEPFFHRYRDIALHNNPKVAGDAALVSAEKTATRFPEDALAQYELGRHYRNFGRIADAENAFDRCIAIVPITNAVVWKARIALWDRGDVAEMKSLIARIPVRSRATERVVLCRWTYTMVSGQTEDGLEALSGLTNNWVEDFEFNGPRALLTAQLFELQGKRELARLQYESALTVVRARQAKAPTDAALRGIEAWILHGLGRDEEARPLSRIALESIPRPYGISRLAKWWFTTIPRCLLTGDKATALELIREAVSAHASKTGRAVTMPAGAATSQIDEVADATKPRRDIEGDDTQGVVSEAPAAARATLRLRFKLDRRIAPFRDDPEIAALLAEP